MNKLELVTKHFIPIITLFLFFVQPNYGQEEIALKIDSMGVEKRSFGKSLSEKYTGDDFNYEATVEGEAENLISRGLNWFFRKLGELFGVDMDPETITIWKNVFYILLILFGIYIITKLLLGQGSGPIFGKQHKNLTNLNILEEDIEQIDFDRLLKEALHQKNYRLAIRYQYLKVLKGLSSKGIIQWHFEKTNYDYFNEIENPAIKSNFKKVSYLYDYVWYGEFDIDEAHYKEAQNEFSELFKGIVNVR